MKKDPWDPVVALKTMTAAVVRGVRQSLRASRVMAGPRRKRAEVISVAVPANWQQKAQESGLSPLDYFLAVGRELGKGLSQRGYRSIGKLPLPLGGAEGFRVDTPKLSVRGLSQYRIDYDDTVYRFDVLGWKGKR